MFGQFLTVCLLVVLSSVTAFAGDPLADYKPKFDPSGAQYTYLLSNITHPSQEACAQGYRIRDAVWERSGGRLYVDYRPLAQLGGERDVINKLKMGAVHGALLSNVAAVNISPKMAITSLPYLMENLEKLEKFRHNEELWKEFADSTLRQGIMTVDIVGYGSYGWGSTIPIKTLEDAKNVNFRIAEAPVSQSIFKNWDLKFTIMPWPDVAQALQTGVIDGLDQTAITCSITKKFGVLKYFTEVNYMQGMFIHMINKRYFEKLPADLQKVLIDVIEEESANTRLATQRQEDALIAKSKAEGIEFFKLSEQDKQKLITLAAPVYQEWSERIGKDYLEKVRTRL
jgi:TRAP-type C4-dicarboxylate transport system substrate-binding protein